MSLQEIIKNRPLNDIMADLKRLEETRKPGDYSVPKINQDAQWLLEDINIFLTDNQSAKRIMILESPYGDIEVIHEIPSDKEIENLKNEGCIIHAKAID